MPSPIHRLVTAFVFAVMATLTAPALADQVLMKNGDIITGNISRIEADEVFIEPSYADEFSVDLAEVASIEADQTFEIELEDGSKVDASFAHGEDGMQTLVVDGEARDIPMTDLVLAEEPEDWYDRDSKVEVNMTFNDGNTDSRNSLIFADTSLKLGDHRHYADLTFRRDETDGEYTKKQDLLNYSYNWFFNDPWYLGATASWERDPIKELDHRYTAGFIMGRDIFDDANRFLTISLGAGYSKEKYFTEEDSGAAALWNLRYTQDFRYGDFAFFHNHGINYAIYGDNNIVFKSSTGFRFDIINDVYANVSLRYDYESDPPENAENEDTTLVIGVGAEF
jgi:putative salt-induced outer membrane protein YdiY